MSKILVLTTDLPYFPGRNGHDFFNLRFLSKKHVVGVAAPLYPFFPKFGVENLRSSVNACYLWPEPVQAKPLLPLDYAEPILASWVKKLPISFKQHLIKILLGIRNQPDDAYLQLAILANLSPYLIEAIHQISWQGLIVIQTNTAPWLDYLPRHLAKTFLFHDIRSDYLARKTEGDPKKNYELALQAKKQETRISQEAEVVVFLSELDACRAKKILFPIASEGMVAPIPVDTEYFTPPPKGWLRSEPVNILFTGHLSHPPNVDAVLFFLENIWLKVLAICPEAMFTVAGMLPRADLIKKCTETPRVNLHPDVPDIRPFFWNASIYIVPMRYGGGVRQKIFEAWSIGIPVVCTTMAAEGTGAVDNEHCFLRDDPEKFALQLVELLVNPELAIDLVSKARQRVQETNSISVAASCFEKAVERSLVIKKQRPFRLLYDLRWMTIGKAGGIEQMTYELIDSIAKFDPVNHYRIFSPRNTYYEWDFPYNFRCKGFFTEAEQRYASALHANFINRLSRDLEQPLVLTHEMRHLRQIKKMDFDIIHSLCSYTCPELMPYPNILTMADLQHIHYPEFFSSEEWQVRENLYRSSSEYAAHITCISEYTRQDMHRIYGIPLEKMTTIWIIPSRAAWVRISLATRQALLGSMGITSNYLFYPAHCWPHKNHARLIEAFAQALPSLPNDIQLILTGKPFPEDHPAALLIRKHRLVDRVRHLGYRTPLEMRALYSGAHALVFPSLFEGFGIPLVEAMIADCPVACGNNTSMPEIAGPAALLFDAEKPELIAEAIVSIVMDEFLRSHLQQEGRKRVSLFSAKEIAVKTLSIYHRVFNELYN